jgi:hypothetical protein
MSCRKYYLSLAFLVVATTSQAAVINFDGFGESKVIDPSGNDHNVPARFDFTMDTTSGVLDLRRLDVYNDTLTAVGYSLPPQLLTLNPTGPSTFSSDVTIEGEPFRVGFGSGQSLPGLGVPPRPAWSFVMGNINREGGIPFTASMLAASPGITQFVFRGGLVHAPSQVPEPAGVVLGLLFLPLAYLARWGDKSNQTPDCACGQVSNHTTHGPEGTIYRCCSCYVKAGCPPADWHPECMKAFAEIADAGNR